MVAVAFVAPYLLETTTLRRGRGPAAGVQLALITSEPIERVPPRLRHYAAATGASTTLSTRVRSPARARPEWPDRPVQRLIGVLEQLQVPLAQVREYLASTAWTWRPRSTSGTRRR
jgi:hypothetical protein